jgi:hypothetical protein
MNSFFLILHTFAVLVLTSQAFTAFSHSEVTARKRTLILSGTSALVILLSGFGMAHRLYQGHVFGWMIIKLVCLVGVAALAGQVYRRTHLRALFAVAALTLLLIALTMVYTKPF